MDRPKHRETTLTEGFAKKYLIQKGLSDLVQHATIALGEEGIAAVRAQRAAYIEAHEDAADRAYADQVEREYRERGIIR